MNVHRVVQKLLLVAIGFIAGSVITMEVCTRHVEAKFEELHQHRVVASSSVVANSSSACCTVCTTGSVR